MKHCTKNTLETNNKSYNIVYLCKIKYGFDLPVTDPISFVHELVNMERRLKSKKNRLYAYKSKNISYFSRSGDFKKRKILLSKIVGAEIKAKGWSDFCYKLDNIYHDFIVNSVYSDSKHLYNEIKSHSFINSSKLEGVKYKNNNTCGIDELLKKYKQVGGPIG